MIEPTNYPLTWPVARTRTVARQRARFATRTAEGLKSTKRLSTAVACDRLSRELELLKAKDVVVSTNIKPTLSGWPGSASQPKDPGVAVYFKLGDKPHCLACDRWDTVADNIAAIAAEIEANRGRERWGVVTLEEAFSGFAALPAKTPWWKVLGFASAPVTWPELKERFRELAKTHHPDRGGDPARMAELTEAYEEGQEKLGGP